MKIVPRNTQVIGRVVIMRPESKIIRPDLAKASKFVLIDAVGAGAAAAGLKVGDVVVPTAMAHLVLDGGARFRPVLEEKQIGYFVEDLPLEKMLIQIDSGTDYVPFGSPDAAQSLGGAPSET